jgi:PIN domain nuclease of toxin-antitoxin system
VRLLLDTHIWIWSLADPSRLAPKVRASLGDPNHELWLSSISVWEVLVLLRKKRLRVADNAQQWVADALARAPLREAPITHAVAVESEIARRHPGDRGCASDRSPIPEGLAQSLIGDPERFCSPHSLADFCALSRHEECSLLHASNERIPHNKYIDLRSIPLLSCPPTSDRHAKSRACIEVPRLRSYQSSVDLLGSDPLAGERSTRRQL